MQVTQGLGAVGGSRVEVPPSGRDGPGNGVPVDGGLPRQPSGAGQPPESRGGLIVVAGRTNPLPCWTAAAGPGDSCRNKIRLCTPPESGSAQGTCRPFRAPCLHEQIQRRDLRGHEPAVACPRGRRDLYSSAARLDMLVIIATASRLTTGAWPRSRAVPVVFDPVPGQKRAILAPPQCIIMQPVNHSPGGTWDCGTADNATASVPGACAPRGIGGYGERPAAAGSTAVYRRTVASACGLQRPDR